MAKSKLNNFIKSDGRTMTVLNKAEILSLRHKGLTMKAIAGKVDRSMDWVSIILDTFEGTNYGTKLIKRWKERKKIKVGTGISRVVKRGSNKKSGIKRVTTRTSTRYTRRHKTIQPRQQEVRVQRTSKSGNIVKTLRKHADYKGDGNV